MRGLVLFSLLSVLAVAAEFSNSIGMRLVEIRPGSFTMGENNTVPEDLMVPLTYPTVTDLRRAFPHGDPNRFVVNFDAFRHGDFDERPVHRVHISRPFFMSACEVTNREYELFDPSHRALRGKRGFSKEDNEAVIFVSWHDARAFCAWLSHKEGRTYRLPTEAEWEYAARAGTATLYATGDHLPAVFLKNAHSSDFRDPRETAPLFTGRTPPNPWGLFDMHGNVEEWTADWYGAYVADAQTDPVGRATGTFRVTRGGSHSTDPYYLRSANRSGNLPQARNWMTGFRIVSGEPPTAAPLSAEAPRRFELNVNRAAPASVMTPVREPYFDGPRRYVKVAPREHGPVYATHNHDTAIAECPNGDLLAIWYTCEQERGRELAVAASRLRYGQKEWEPASPFWDTPDRNDHCPALWYDGKRTLYHFNGASIAGKWQPLMIVMRTSTDSGVTWSKPRLISAEYGYRSMVGQPVFRSLEGFLVFGADADSGSTFWMSRDGGANWADSDARIRGVHAGIVQLRDGRILALGRGQNIDGRMPVSISPDWGKSWEYKPAIWPPINGSQRLVLLRLKEGPLLLITFAKDPARLEWSPPEGVDGRGMTSMVAAVSYDEGRTWPDRRVVTDGKPEHGAATLGDGWIRMSPRTSEPIGYLAATQARNGVIHLISSINHYAFNLAWIQQGQPSGERGPAPKSIRAKPILAEAIDPGLGTIERTGLWDDLAPRRGFTIEANGTVFELDALIRTGLQTTNCYGLRVSAGAVEYRSGTGWMRLAAGDGAPHRYRLAVRGDTAVEIYRDGERLGVQDAWVTINWRQAARGKYAAWSGSLLSLSYDLEGPFEP
ncbi:MAG: SUMF1/EgtB/PvdO family nonheme iron enzyme [Bryobacterales bacterium]|nr:SUMF1/EgtB/PvdO family nonheme iron enzyme [Bryobacterales bacterium]